MGSHVTQVKTSALWWPQGPMAPPSFLISSPMIHCLDFNMPETLPTSSFIIQSEHFSQCLYSCHSFDQGDDRKETWYFP